MSEKLVEGKVALVTGGGSGIGRGATLVFAREGARGVVIADRDRDGGAETVALLGEAGCDARFVETDVTGSGEVRAMVDAAVGWYGTVDCAFNNAGIDMPWQRVVDGDEDAWDRVIAVNLKGVFLCMQAELAHMVDHGGGAIVNTSSTAGLLGTRGASNYTAAKHGVLGLTKTAALEYGERGIRVNAVCPGPIQTPMLKRALGDNEEYLRGVAASTVVGRLGVPADVAEAVVWLCSDRSAYVTGLAVPVDGGLVQAHGALHQEERSLAK
jgi:NAD(P)-dependent dehydrogenase (short-subunit alcohol dehydrogenase family)